MCFVDRAREQKEIAMCGSADRRDEEKRYEHSDGEVHEGDT